MEKVEIIAVIKYLCKKGMSPKEIHKYFMDTLWTESPSYSTVKNGLLNLRGAGRKLQMLRTLGGGRAKEATNDETAEAVHGLVMCDKKARPAKHC
jgi:transposase